MDFVKLATDVTVFLTPFFPYLILAGEEAAKEAGKKFGSTAWEKAASLWNSIKNFSKGDIKMKRTVESLAEDPDDEDFQLILAKLLAKQFELSPELATELINRMKDDKAIQTVIIENESKAKNIYQRLSKGGVQKTVVRDKSEVDDITQDM